MSTGGLTPQRWVHPGHLGRVTTYTFITFREDLSRQNIDGLRHLELSPPPIGGNVEVGLGLGPRVVAQLGWSEALAEPLHHMADRRRLLGDPDPRTWKVGGAAAPDVLLVHSGDERSGVAERARQAAGIFPTAEAVVVQAAHLDDRQSEHFGFRDGVTQPLVLGLDDVSIATMPPIPQSALFLGPERHDFRSLSVVRLLRQDVAAFRDFCAGEARRLGVRSDWIAARVVGRWPSGAPVTLFPDADPGMVPDREESFDFADDLHGSRCPVGAHIRLVNPRRGHQDDDVDERRIIRRGVPWGPRFDDQPVADRGLVFVAHQSSITRQFEFVQRSWIRNPDRPVGGAGHDLLVGPEPQRAMPITLPDSREVTLRADQVFVECVGGGYFVAPSVKDARPVLAVD